MHQHRLLLPRVQATRRPLRVTARSVQADVNSFGGCGKDPLAKTLVVKGRQHPQPTHALRLPWPEDLRELVGVGSDFVTLLNRRLPTKPNNS